MRKEDCIFCKIAGGDIPSSTVYEDNDFRAIMDISPANKGHVIILPKEHAANVFELPEELAGKANAECVYLDVEKPYRGHYRLTFREMPVPEAFRQRSYPVSLTFFQMLEQTIRRQPEIWLWSHNRWSKRTHK